MNDDSLGGWRSILTFENFGSVARSVLIDRFTRHGLVQARAPPHGDCIAFAGTAGIVEVGYERDLLANFRPAVVVRPRETDAPSPYAVPLWFVIPDSRPERSYPSWDFADEDALRKVLDRLFSEVIEPHALPLADDRTNLAAEMQRFLHSMKEP
ncbi:MAG TPA: hypothetical protein VLT59_09430 [Steroidobacteraceae bacterium]|nr:hypothetical protein [Steroidobacteraceae bacterium]